MSNIDFATGSVAAIIAHAAGRDVFTADDIRSFCAANGVEAPRHPNQWGRVYSRLAFDGVIVKVAVEQSHRGPRARGTHFVWTAGPNLWAVLGL